MNQKKAKKIRKKLKLDLGRDGAKPEYKVVNKTEKTIYTTNNLGIKKLVNVEVVTIVNATKWQYRNIKKMIKKGEVHV